MYTVAPSLGSRSQYGAVLVVSLVLLMVLTLVAVVAMQSTAVDQKIVTNVAYKTKSLESSESARPKAADLLDAHVFERGWTGLFKDGTTAESDTHSGLFVVDNEDNNRNLFLKNDDSEDPLTPSSLTKDMAYERTTGSEKLAADLSVYLNRVSALPGHSAAMVAGYEGQGKAMAGSGAAQFYDIRSTGMAAAHATTVTSADVRIMVRN